MVLDNEPIFESFLIKTNKKTNKSLEEIKEESVINSIIEDHINTIGEIKLDEEKAEEHDIQKEGENKLEEPKIMDNLDSLEEIEPLDLLQPEEQKTEENISLDIEFEDLMEDIQENNDVLKEINNDDLNLDKNESSMKLKKPNQVYFELYKEARNKAKQAKKSAILAYLEAKNIKKTYMIENINDSDSDFDAEIDDVSESELEGL